MQFLLLAYASTQPELTANSGNLALLSLSAKLKLIDPELGAEVQEIYRQLRRLQHKMKLNNATQNRTVLGDINITPVLTLWKNLLGETAE